MQFRLHGRSSYLRPHRAPGAYTVKSYWRPQHTRIAGGA